MTMIFKFSQYLLPWWGIDTNKLFSLLTQPWRHLGAILWIHVIIHIFITFHSKSTIFNAHKLQAICQHIGLFISGLYQIRARARASKFRMLKITYKQFCVRTRSFRAFQNFPSVRVRARVVRAYSARKSQNSKLLHDLDSSYHNWQFPFIFIHSWPFIRPCERVKV